MAELIEIITDKSSIEVIVPKEKEIVEVSEGIKGDTGISITDATIGSDGHFTVKFSNGQTKDTGLTAFMDVATYNAEAKAASASASASATTATTQASTATTKANTATEQATLAKQYADLAQSIKNSMGTTCVPKGSVNTYADLPTSPEPGWLINIKTADPTHSIKAGDNVIWTVDGTWDDLSGNIDLSEYAKTADVPTKTSQLTNDSGYITGVTWDSVTGKPTTFPPSAHTQAASTVTGLATVATSGKYSDLTGTPTIPTQTSQLTNNSGYVTSTASITGNAATATKATQDASGNIITSTYATKASIPTKVSALTNDSGYITSSASISGNASTATKATQDSLGNVISDTYATKTSIPTKVSSLTNDSGYITSSSSITGNAATATKATQDASGNVISSTYTKLPVTISATLASGSAKNTINNSNITADSLILLGVPTTATKEQIDMIGAAVINCTSQTAGSITLTALGTSPTTNIPITLTIVG